MDDFSFFLEPSNSAARPHIESRLNHLSRKKQRERLTNPTDWQWMFEPTRTRVSTTVPQPEPGPEGHLAKYLEPFHHPMMMPRPGYVFAEHYYTLDHFKDPEYQPNELKAVKLERDGSLDLNKVKDAFKVRFGEGSTFETRKGSCIPVDPVRWKFFESKEVDKLSALAVKTLSEREGHIAFVEFRTNDEYLAALRARKTKHEEGRDVIDEDISRLTEIRRRYNNQ